MNMPASEALESYTIKKLHKIGKKHDDLIRIDVFFKRKKDSKGRGRVCDMEISLPGPRIFASSDEKNYEMAVKNTISDLQVQLKKRKGVFRPYM